MSVLSLLEKLEILLFNKSGLKLVLILCHSAWASVSIIFTGILRMPKARHICVGLFILER